MTVIQATSAGIRDMADGSLRITLEFDPRYAKEAYSLFGARGTACAIAALTTEAATHAAQKEAIAPPVELPKEKVGDLCLMACKFCASKAFWRWIEEVHIRICSSGELAKNFILVTCSIESRKDLDTNAMAAKKFHREIREPFLAWRESRA